MNMKKIIYYTHIYFLDVALEVVGQLAQHYDVYLYIELAPESLHANIFNLDTELKDYDTITPFEQVKDSWNLGFYKPYFEKLKAVNFVVFGKNRSISLYAWRKSFAVRASFRRVKADYIHYDDFSIRQLWMVPFFTLNKKRFVLNVHDPKPHSGEKSLKRALIKRAIFRAAGRFVCFSEYSRTLLGTFEDGQKITDLRLTPYTFTVIIYLLFHRLRRVSPLPLWGAWLPIRGSISLSKRPVSSATCIPKPALSLPVNR